MAFNFGAPAPSGGAPAPGAAPASGFSFVGASGNTNASTGGGFSFGGAPANTTPALSAFGSSPTPATTTAPAPLGGFSFSSASSAPAASGGFSFGGSTPNAPTPAAPSGGLFGSALSSLSAGQASANNSVGTPKSVLKVPDFNDVFPSFQLSTKIRVLEGKLSNGDHHAAQQLLELMEEKEELSKPSPPIFSAANTSLRQKLQNNPYVDLDKVQAAFRPEMLNEVFAIADHLHLSEGFAISIYREASKSDVRKFLQGNSGKILGSIVEAASKLFFLQRSALLESILLLCQCRLEHKLLEATDMLLKKNLISNLVTLIYDLTKLASQLYQSSTQPMPASSKVWLSHLNYERQLAAECLFYLTYSTQCTAAEVVTMVDLIQSLTNEALGVLDPVKDVPDAYYPQPQVMQWGGPFTQPLSPLQEKDAREWEEELVKNVWNRKEPFVLQCVSVLTMTVICALDTKQELLNREIHTVNDFGVGNALFSTLNATGSLNELSSIHERLHGDTAVAQWKRKDIWGVLAAAYALSLRPVSSVVGSPRAQQASMVKQAWKACLTAPTDHKSFTFVRLSLMPAISNTRKASDPCDLHEFLLSVLSEFLAHYLDIVCASNTIPPSRSQWYKNENEVLEMKRDEQERARSFYQSYAGGGTPPQEEVPSEVDLSKRPDCIDDVIAVAIALCSQGPDYASKFWSREESRTDNGLHQVCPIPSRALKKLELLQDTDKSLIPSYISFLAALAIAESGAVFDLLNSTGEESKSMDWKTLFSTLRWYVRKMSDGYAGEAKPTTKSSEMAGARSSYYYGADDDGDNGGVSASATNVGTSPSNSSTKLKELGDMNTAIVLSHLAVITKVAAYYASGRAHLVSMKLSLEDSDEGDSVLVVLFSLSIAPLTPQVRGAVFATLAALLKVDGAFEKDESQIRDMARKGWDLLELSQAVPVLALDQYQGKDSSAIAQAMAFPPSSISAANSGTANAWLPVDQKFGVIFEMEHVESRLGYYPSTEGLLQLLASLIISAGCPSDLGQSAEQGKPARYRPGCTPYLEYVVSFVIPRALGSNKKEDRLPFQSGVDCSRLVSRGLKVVEAVLARYAVPLGSKGGSYADQIRHQKTSLASATSLLRLPEVTRNLMVPPTEADMSSFIDDFDVTKSTVRYSENTKSVMSLPRAKSPGYSVLSDVLSSSNSDLLRGLGLILTEDGGCDGIHSIYGRRDGRFRVAWALFGDAMPSIATAKHKQENVRSFPLQTLLLSLQPPLDVASDLRSSTDAIYWKLMSMGSALRILGAAAIREQDFLRVSSGVVNIIPTLQFKAKTNVVQKKEIHLTSLRDALKQYTSPSCLPAIVECLKPLSSDDTEDSEISGISLALLVYCFAKSSVSSSLSALNAVSVPGELRFVRAVSERFRMSSKRTERKADADIVRVILSLIESEMSYILLGFPHKSVDGLDAPGVVTQPYEGTPNECFSILLDRLSDDDFLTSPRSSGVASTCFKIISNMMLLKAETQIGAAVCEHLTYRLREVDFWNTGIMKFFALRDKSANSLLALAIEKGKGSVGVENVLHGAAYFLNGLATHCARQTQLSFSQDSLSTQNQRLLSNLLDKDNHLLCNLLACLPLQNEKQLLSFPKHLLPLQSAVESSMHQMQTQPDSLTGYMLIGIEKLKMLLESYGKSGEDMDECIEWGETWNRHVQWDYAAAHLSGATTNLMEAALEYSDWSLQSGISNLLHQPKELLIDRDNSLLILLDQISERLIGKDERFSSMSNRLLKTASINLCTEVLLLVDRLLASSRNREHLPYFVERIGLATMSSLTRHGSSPLPEVDDEERSVMLGTAMSQILDSDSLEISEQVQNSVCTVAASFSELCCRNASLETADEITLRRAKISLASRSILSSFIGSLDLMNNGDTNPIVTTLATTTLHSSTSKTALQALVQVISSFDDNVCLLLESVACTSDGTAHLVNAGVMKSLYLASTGYSNSQQSKRSSMTNPPSFFSSHLSLLRTLLASDSLSEEKQDMLRTEALSLLVSYTSVVQHLGEVFPQQGEIWLNFVQTLALAKKDKRKSKSTFANSARLEVPGIDRIVENVFAVTAKLIKHPFPARFQPILHPKLQDEEAEWIWWEPVEQQIAISAAATDLALPDPPSGLTFGRSSSTNVGGVKDNNGAWSAQKYEAAFAAAQVVDASLTFLIEESSCETPAAAEFPVKVLAQGLCRFTDSSRAMLQRLNDIDAFSKGGAMDLGAFDSQSKEAMQVEKSCLEEIAPLFGRCCEKLLLLCHGRYSKMHSANEESFRGLASIPSVEMKSFAECVLLALRHTRLETLGITSSLDDLDSSTFVKMLAKSLHDDLSRIMT